MFATLRTWLRWPLPTPVLWVLFILCIAGVVGILRSKQYLLELASPARVIGMQVQKPTLVIRGQDLTRVELWAVPAGSEKKEESIKLGEATMMDQDPYGTQEWRFLIPKDPLSISEIFAKAFASYKQKEVGTAPLSLMGREQLYDALWDNHLDDDPKTWREYANPDGGLRLRYPPNVQVGAHNGSADYSLVIRATPFDLIGHAGMTEEQTPEHEQKELAAGKFGYHWESFPPSRKVEKMGLVNAKSYMMLGREDDSCNIAISMQAVYFYAGHQVELSFLGPNLYNIMIEERPEAFEIQSSCNNLGWKEGAKELLYADLEVGKAPEALQNWYDMWKKLFKTVEIR